MEKLYLCSELSEGVCLKWVEYQASDNFINELSQLTFAQSSELLSLTGAIFALAWLFKHLSLTAKRG